MGLLALGLVAFAELIFNAVIFFVGLTEEQAIELARRLIRSEIMIEMQVRVTMRSVEVFTLNNAFLQVWGLVLELSIYNEAMV